MQQMWSLATRLAREPEWAMLVLSGVIAIVHIARGSGSGKILYWVGATILMAGVLRMK